MYRPVFELSCFRVLPPEVKVQIIEKLLEALIFANECWLRAGNEGTPPLYQSGVPYVSEPPGRDNWQDIPRTIELREGDCEDLACWRIAELRVKFKEPRAAPHVIYKELGDFTLFHIQVRRQDGSVEDPSKHLGMR